MSWVLAGHFDGGDTIICFSLQFILDLSYDVAVIQ